MDILWKLDAINSHHLLSRLGTCHPTTWIACTILALIERVSVEVKTERLCWEFDRSASRAITARNPTILVPHQQILLIVYLPGGLLEDQISTNTLALCLNKFNMQHLLITHKWTLVGSSSRPRSCSASKSFAEACTEPVEVTAKGATCLQTFSAPIPGL